MIRANEVQKGPDEAQFSLAALEGTRVRPRVAPTRPEQDVPLPQEINLSGSEFLIRVASAIGLTGLLLWALLKLWLFE